jgi:hypothetical protein
MKPKGALWAGFVKEIDELGSKVDVDVHLGKLKRLRRSGGKEDCVLAVASKLLF